MKVLVSGGAGFIGSHIVDGLINKGHEVIIVDDLSAGNKDYVNDKAKFYKLDIQDPGMDSIFQKYEPDYVIHQAAQKDVRLSVADPIYDARINILGTINILQNCIKYKVKKVVFASTGGAIYGEQDVFPAPETHPSRPISPYGITKLVTEHYLYYYKTVFGMDYASLRYSNVYGPRQDPFGEAGVVAIFITKMLKGEKSVINGDGEQTRDFVYVDDVANANIIAMESTALESIFNIGTGIETSINRIFDSLKDNINLAIHSKHGPAKQGEQLRSVIECSRAKEILGWEPKILLEDGLRLTCEFLGLHS